MCWYLIILSRLKYVLLSLFKLKNFWNIFLTRDVCTCKPISYTVDVYYWGIHKIHLVGLPASLFYSVKFWMKSISKMSGFLKYMYMFITVFLNKMENDYYFKVDSNVLISLLKLHCCWFMFSLKLVTLYVL